MTRGWMGDRSGSPFGPTDDDEGYGDGRDFGATENEVIESLQEGVEQLMATCRALKHQRDQFMARNDHLTKLLSAILMVSIPAPPVTLADGRVMQFVDPNPARTLKMLQDAIEKARAAQATGYELPQEHDHGR